jgi:peptide/nickel transport system permease protein
MNEAQKKKHLEAQPMWKIVLSQFAEHKMAVIGAVVIGFFLSIALFAPVISSVTGLEPQAQNVFNRYQPVFSSAPISAIERELRVERFIQQSDAVELKDALIQSDLLGFETQREDVLYDFATYFDPKELMSHLEGLRPVPGLSQFKSIVADFDRFHLLGTDELGRDVFIRLVYGTRISISVGILVAFSAAMIGLIVGSLAGFYGGALDSVLMRMTDSLIALPILVVLIVVSAIDLENVFGGSPFAFVVGSDYESIVKMVLILMVFSWMQVARLVRGSILAIKEQEFVMAARTLGAKDRTIILTHMVPNVIAPLLVAVTLGVGNSILMEAALSFLGLGIQPPTPSWGNMLFNAQEMIQHSPMLAILPGLLILFTVISFNYVGDGLQDAIDPKAIRR